MNNALAADVFCADIGSVTKGNFGWFGVQDGCECQGSDIGEFARTVSASIQSGRGLCIGFEAPMFAPVRSDPLTLTLKRRGERGINWIGGPGASVLVTALAQIPWILTEVLRHCGVVPTLTFDWLTFRSGQAKVFFWEAFVSGDTKGTTHVEDAQAAVKAFRAALPDPTAFNAIEEPEVLNLIAASLIRTGWSDDISALAAQCLVIRALPNIDLQRPSPPRGPATGKKARRTNKEGRNAAMDRGDRPGRAN